MKKIITKVKEFLKGEKYSNVPGNTEMPGNITKPASKTSYTVEEDEYGYKHFKKDGVTHKLSGPAIIYRSGAVKYYVDGVELSEEQHAENYLNCNL